MRKPRIIAKVMALAVAALFLLQSTADSTLTEELRTEYARPTETPFPAENPFSASKAKLGKVLFFDKRLSLNNDIACSSCHDPNKGWEDGNARSKGSKGTLLGRHTPTIQNLAWGVTFFWDGRAETLEAQALGPIQDESEMASNMDQLVAELQAISGYRDLFSEAFGDETVSPERIGKAIATYERTVVTPDSPFDHWVAGDENAISSNAKRGFEIFNTKANCASCHSGWNFTDDGFYNIGLADVDPGRYAQLPIAALQHTFKTPGLRELSSRAPYMHDGSISTLEEVIDHYDEGFKEHETLSHEVKKLHLSAEDKSDLIAFLRTLDSEQVQISAPNMPR